MCLILETLKTVIGLCVPDASVREICTKGDNLLTEETGKVSSNLIFAPTNTSEISPMIKTNAIEGLCVRYCAAGRQHVCAVKGRVLPACVEFSSTCVFGAGLRRLARVLWGPKIHRL